MIRADLIAPARLVATTAIPSALALLPDAMTSPAARATMLAIGLVESRLKFRRQLPSGPARGLWQFERGGGVVGVLQHPETKAIARRVLVALGIPTTSLEVWRRLEYDDVAAAVLARLLLWTDPAPLPARDDVAAAWALYMRVWRPGAYTKTWRPGDPPGRPWPDMWATAWAVEDALTTNGGS